MSDLLLIAVVSGKGGVGKTMLSVAIACEIARSRRTLLIDLDFFNRGLTGLFSSLAAKSPRQPLVAPQDLVRTVDGNDWAVANVGENLSVVTYGDVDRASSDALESMDVNLLGRHVYAFVLQVCRVAGCDVAILDCHGGPDNTSFAASIVSRHTILVSEPDKITLYGTLNFLRRLDGIVPDRRPDIRLVFNKVIPAFSARFLFGFYRRLLAPQFNSRDLLAIYPMEVHLTKAFERAPFLTTVYPTSQLAEKTRLLLYDLLAGESPDLLPAAIRRSGRITRLFHKYYMGRWSRLLDPDFIYRVIAIVVFVLLVVPVLAAAADARMAIPVFQPLEQIDGEGVFGFAMYFGLFCWVMFAVALKWARDLDVFLTYSFRTKSVGGALLGCATLTVLASVVSVLFAAVGMSLMQVTGFWILAAAVGMPLIPLLWYARRGLRNMRYDRRFVEGGFRLGFAVGVPAIGVLLAWTIF